MIFSHGYDVMMAKYLADKMGQVEIHKIDWNSLTMALQAGPPMRHRGQSIIAIFETVDFTTPYYYASIVALTMKDSKYAMPRDSRTLGRHRTSQLNTAYDAPVLLRTPTPARHGRGARDVAALAEPAYSGTYEPTALGACV